MYGFFSFLCEQYIYIFIICFWKEVRMYFDSAWGLFFILIDGSFQSKTTGNNSKDWNQSGARCALNSEIIG